MLWGSDLRLRVGEARQRSRMSRGPRNSGSSYLTHDAPQFPDLRAYSSLHQCHKSMRAAPGRAAPATNRSPNLIAGAVPSDLKRSSSSIDSQLSTPSTEQSSWLTGDTDGGLQASTNSLGIHTLLYEAQVRLRARKTPFASRSLTHPGLSSHLGRNAMHSST